MDSLGQIIVSQTIPSAEWGVAWNHAVLAPDLLRWKIIRRNVCTAVASGDSWGYILSTDPVEPNRTLLQDNHLLRGHIAFSLQRIEVSAASHLLSRLRPPIPVDGTISP